MVGNTDFRIPLQPDSLAKTDKAKEEQSPRTQEVSKAITGGHEKIPIIRQLPTPPLDQQLARVIRELDIKSGDFTVNFARVQDRITDAVRLNEITPEKQAKLVEDLTKKSNEHARAQIPSTIEEFSSPETEEYAQATQEEMAFPGDDETAWQFGTLTDKKTAPPVPHQNLKEMAKLSKELDTLETSVTNKDLKKISEKIKNLEVDSKDPLQKTRLDQLLDQFEKLQNVADGLSSGELYSPETDESPPSTTNTFANWSYDEDNPNMAAEVDETTFDESEWRFGTLDENAAIGAETVIDPDGIGAETVIDPDTSDAPLFNDTLDSPPPAAATGPGTGTTPKALVGKLKELEEASVPEGFKNAQKMLLKHARGDTDKPSLDACLQEFIMLPSSAETKPYQLLLDAYNQLSAAQTQTASTTTGTVAKNDPTLESFKDRFTELKNSGTATKESCQKLVNDIIGSQRGFLDRPASNKLIDEIRIFKNNLQETVTTEEKSRLTSCVNYLKNLFGIGKVTTLKTPSASESKSFFSALGSRILSLFKKAPKSETESARTEEAKIPPHDPEKFKSFDELVGKLRGDRGRGKCLIFKNGSFEIADQKSAKPQERLAAVKESYKMLASALENGAITVSDSSKDVDVMRLKARVDGGMQFDAHKVRLDGLDLGKDILAFEKIIKFHQEKEKSTSQILDIEKQNKFLKTNIEIIEKFTISRLSSILAKTTLTEEEKKTLLDMVRNPKEGVSVATYIKQLNIATEQKELLSQLGTGLELIRGAKVKFDNFESGYVEFIKSNDPEKAPHIGPLVQSQFKETIASLFAEIGKDIPIEKDTVKEMFKANAAASGEAKPIDWELLSKQLKPQTLLRSTAGLQLLFQSPSMVANLKAACDSNKSPENFNFMEQYTAYLNNPSKEGCEALNRLIGDVGATEGLNLPAKDHPHTQIADLLQDYDKNKEAIGALLAKVFTEVSSNIRNNLPVG